MKNTNKKYRNHVLGMKNNGFTMVELIIVIAIMVLLAGFLAPALIKYVKKSRKSVDIDTAKEIRDSIQRIVADQEEKGEIEEESESSIITFTWDSNSMPNYSQPSTMFDYICKEMGRVPACKVDPDWSWEVKYDSGTGIVQKINLISDQSKKYEILPDHSEFDKMK